LPKKLEDCVKKVMAQGKSQSEAFAICNANLKMSKNTETDCNCPKKNKVPTKRNVGVMGIYGASNTKR